VSEDNNEGIKARERPTYPRINGLFVMVTRELSTTVELSAETKVVSRMENSN
jgi:hypothetical protein